MVPVLQNLWVVLICLVVRFLLESPSPWKSLGTAVAVVRCSYRRRLVVRPFSSVGSRSPPLM